MPGRPVVSVVVPCFRQARLLPAALESVFRQTYPAVEAVVVNDGSDDDTDEVARAFLPRIRYVRQKNAGLPAARNAGIDAATGTYLLFLDADDLLHPEAVAWLAAAAGGRDDVLAACGWRSFESDPATPSEPDEVPTEAEPFPRLIHTNLGPVHAVLCPRRMVDAVGRFDPALPSCEDWDLWSRLAVAGAGLARVPHVGAYYRRAAASMSTNRPRMLAARVAVLLRTFAGMSRSPELLRKWGADLAAAAYRVRRRLRAQDARPDLAAELTAMLDDLAGRKFRPPVRGKEAALARLVGRDWADRLVLAYYRRFDRPMFDFYHRGYA